LGPVRQWAAGYILTLAAPVSFTLHGIELADRLGENFGVRFDLEPLYTAGKITRAYLRASWTREHLPPLPTLETAREAGMLGVDLNADHFAAARIDASGNPLGAPRSIPLVQAGPASLRNARLREAITALLDLAEDNRCGNDRGRRFELHRPDGPGTWPRPADASVPEDGAGDPDVAGPFPAGGDGCPPRHHGGLCRPAVHDQIARSIRLVCRTQPAEG